MLPTFIIAGAHKSGTTSLWEYLKVHPQICMAKIKETNFFTAQGPAARYDKGLEWYQSLYLPCKNAKAIGEVSPNYMFSEDSPRLMHAIVPKVKLLFILRDPVKRVYSHYWYQHQEGIPLPGFEQMVAERHPQLEHYLYVSAYHLHLERFLEYFPRERVTVLLNSDLRLTPNPFMQHVYQVIGVEPDVAPPNLDEQYNTARRARFYGLQRIIEASGLKIMRLDLPDWLFDLLKEGRKALWRLNSSAIQYPPMSPEIRRELIDELSPAIAYVETYLGREIPAWRET